MVSLVEETVALTNLVVLVVLILVEAAVHQVTKVQTQMVLVVLVL
jgi:hypothetical protein